MSSGSTPTSPDPDPEPSRSTGLEPGGGVPPGETPADSGSVDPGTDWTGSGRRTITPWIMIGIAVLIVVAMLVFFIARIADLLT